MQQTDCNWHDPGHGWIDGQQVMAPPYETIMRLFQRIYLRSRKELPEVDRDTRFIIRRQLRRSLSLHSPQLVLSKLPRLEHLVYEPWRQWQNGCQVITDDRRSTTPYFTIQPTNRQNPESQTSPRSSKTLSQTRKTLTIFQDFNNTLATNLSTARPRPPPSWGFQIDTTRTTNPTLVTAFAARSLPVQTLSVSYMITAGDFFLACPPSPTCT